MKSHRQVVGSRTEASSIIGWVRAVLERLESESSEANVPYHRLGQALRYEQSMVTDEAMEGVIDALRLQTQDDCVIAALWLEHNVVPDRFRRRVRQVLEEVAQCDSVNVDQRFMATVALWSQSSRSGRRRVRQLLRELLLNAERGDRVRLAVRLVERRAFRVTLAADLIDVFLMAIGSVDVPLDAKKDAVGALADLGENAEHAKSHLIAVALDENNSRSLRVSAAHVLVATDGKDEKVGRLVERLVEQYPDACGLLFARTYREASSTDFLDNDTILPPIMGKGSGSARAHITNAGDEGSKMSSELEAFERSLEKIPKNNARRLVPFIKRLVPEEDEMIIAATVRYNGAVSIEDGKNPFKERVQLLFDWLSGQSFKDVEATRSVTRMLQAKLTQFGLRVECPKAGCGEPASITCDRGNSISGSYTFQHQATGGRRKHGGYAEFPQLTVVFAPLLCARLNRSVV